MANILQMTSLNVFPWLKMIMMYFENSQKPLSDLMLIMFYNKGQTNAYSYI